MIIQIAAAIPQLTDYLDANNNQFDLDHFGFRKNRLSRAKRQIAEDEMAQTLQLQGSTDGVLAIDIKKRKLFR